ncbi:MAG: hypothetical protein AAGN35_26330 [Bacteroidota bacterium]
MEIRYIAPGKIPLHLKLRRQLTQYLCVGEHYGLATIDWLVLAGDPSGACQCTLVRSIDEGGGLQFAVPEFPTIAAEIEAEPPAQCTGSLAECLDWAKAQGGSEDRFGNLASLNAIYRDLVEQGIAGN